MVRPVRKDRPYVDQRVPVPGGGAIPRIFAGLILNNRSSSCSVNPFARRTFAQWARRASLPAKRQKRWGTRAVNAEFVRARLEL
jgi:hypothetical protein